MCGICGAVRRRGSAPPDRTAIERATRALRHRGPDGDGFHFSDTAAFGQTRLSIIDLERGQQPLWNEDRTILTIFNGEIWNHEELRRTLEPRGHRFVTRADTEVLVHGYEEWGEGLLDRLDGMFAFALFDTTRERLLLARDRVGKKPLYFSETDDGIVFGSDVRSVLLVGGVRPEVERSCVAEYLFQRYIAAPRTLVRGVQKLLPGHLLTYDRERVETRAYWRLEPGVPEPIRGDELRRLLHDAVERRLMSDVPIGVLLSGGVDSGAVLGLMDEAGAAAVSSFTIGFVGAGAVDERPLAQQIAKRYGTDHHEVVVDRSEFLAALPRLAWYRDEPIAEPSEIPLLLLADFAGRHVKVVLTGDGGDELFGGYPKYRVDRFLRAGGRTAAAALEIAVRSLAGRQTHRFLARAAATMRVRDETLRWASWFRTFAPEDLSGLLRVPVDPEDLARPLGNALAPFAAFDAGRRMLIGDFLTYLPDNMLLRSDKVLMAASVEGRMPLLDRRIVERVANVPAGARSGLWSGKAVLRDAVGDLLPLELMNQPKRGFIVPVASFLLDDPSRALQRIVLSERALDRGFFEPAALRALVERGQDLELFTLAMLELYLRANVDEVTEAPPDIGAELLAAPATAVPV
jgi:asparagine synthase (glutamine-hydrolysing)